MNKKNIEIVDNTIDPTKIINVDNFIVEDNMETLDKVNEN